MNKQIRLSIIKVLKYFSFFRYYPTSEEIHTFLRVKISKMKLEKELKRLKYTPVEYSIRRKISQKKINNWRFQLYIKLVSLFPQIRLIGLSGSISMMNADKDDDIDLFIITAGNRLFTGRLIALILAQLLGLRRSRNSRTNHQSPVTSHYANKVCLNLFFDESDLKVPKLKQTEFVGHEVLQMKPIINKSHVYERFLGANKWVFRLFPNAYSVFSMKYKVSGIKKILNTKYLILDTINDWLEYKLKSFQMRSINKHKTTEIITPTQLWFHPDDFEKKIII